MWGAIEHHINKATILSAILRPLSGEVVLVQRRSRCKCLEAQLVVHTVAEDQRNVIPQVCAFQTLDLHSDGQRRHREAVPRTLDLLAEFRRSLSGRKDTDEASALRNRPAKGQYSRFGCATEPRCAEKQSINVSDLHESKKAVTAR